MEGIRDIVWHGEVNDYFMIIVSVYFYATLQATGPINIHRVILSDGLYEVIYVLFSNIFYSKVINNQ